MLSVTIIIPVYNMETYLAECLQGIQAQDFKDYEVIVVDDGSTDRSYEIAAKYAAEDARINVVHKINEGVSIARNVGIELAKGDWIMFVDPDDTVESSLVSELIASTNENIDIVSCCCNAFSKYKIEEDHFFPSSRCFSTNEEKKDLYKQLMVRSYGQPGSVYSAIGVPWGKLYRRSFLEESHLRFIPRLKRCQDNIFNMYAFFYAKNIVYIDRPLYNYRIEHIEKFVKMYRPGYADYMGDLCEERLKCLKTLGLIDDQELKIYFRLEMLNRLWTIFQYDIFNSKNTKTFKEEKLQANLLCNKECFYLLLAGNGKIFHGKDRLKWWLISNRLYWIMQVGFRFF